ncbi:MAG: NAD-dependent epimerase/dehydratase family protein [Alphaproteobacteria bacterium]|nr:NAD-dependent epimerase/dehydratase family protein [Alphaproteobacteria bacterium]
MIKAGDYNLLAKYIVTGGTGFIGTHLVRRLLAGGHEVHVISRGGTPFTPFENVTYHQADIANRSALETALAAIGEADGCFHLAGIADAGYCQSDPAKSNETNVDGSANVLEAIGATPVVCASSAMVGTNTVYGLHKQIMEDIAKPMNNALCVRFYNVYGEGGKGVVNLFTDRALHQQSLIVFGDGQQTRDMIHVSDITTYLTEAMEMLHGDSDYEIPDNRILHACTGVTLTAHQIAETVSQEAFSLTGFEAPIDFREMPEGSINVSLSGTPLPTLPTQSFTNGVQKLISNYDSSPQAQTNDHVSAASPNITSNK